MPDFGAFSSFGSTGKRKRIGRSDTAGKRIKSQQNRMSSWKALQIQ
jgi:hypothetical protein